MRPVELLALLATLVHAGVASAQEDSAEVEPPVVMRLAYATYDGGGGIEVEKRLAWLGSVLRDVAKEARSAGFHRPIEFSIHWANPYQAYEWLRRGHVDAAIVTPLIGVLLVPEEASSDYAILADVRKKRETAGKHGVWIWVRKLKGTNPDERVPATDLGPIEALHETFQLALDCADRLREQPARSCLEQQPPDPEEDDPCRSLRTRRVHVYSHLTPAFLAPIAEADQWLARKIGKDREPERAEGFWRQLRTLLEIHPIPRTYQEPGGVEFRLSYSDKEGRELLPNPSRIPDDVLVVRRSFVAELLELEDEASERTRAKEALDARIEALRNVFQGAKSAVEPCDDKSYVRFERHDADTFDPFRRWIDDLRRRRPGIGPELSELYLKGDYEFTISEIADLLLQDQLNSQEHDLALVLPGGGVKAAYQARLLDRLYDSHLVNSPEGQALAAQARGTGAKPAGSGDCAKDADADEAAGPGEGREPKAKLHVRRVIGTSGGAITGIFAALRPPPEAGEPPDGCCSLTRLWESNQLSEETIFSPVEAPRWAGVVATIVVFALIVVLGGRSERLVSHSAREGRRADPWLLLVCGALVLFFPWILKWQNPTGQLGRELWPDALLFAWLVFFSYGALSLVRVEVPTGEARGSPRLPRWVMIGAATLTLSLALLAAFASRGADSAMALALELLVVAAAIAFTWWEARRAGRWIHPPRRFVAAAGVVGMVILLTHLGLFALPLVSSRFSRLELTTVYWLGLVGLAAVCSLLCLWLGPRLHWFEEGITYLCESQAHRIWHGRRVVGLAALGILGFGYWNYLIAPGLYGTRLPFEALEANLTAYGVKPDPATGRYELETDLILTAATLGSIGAIREGDLYFCIQGPGGCGHPVESERTGRRWLVQPANQELLKHLIVASGAAFPVFAPHEVIGVQVPASADLEPDTAPAVREDNYYLIDGGYGHNVPIEAAELAGSRQVLLVHASPRPASPKPASDEKLTSDELRPAGHLVDYLQRIPGFLFDRSQQLDYHARERLVVASLAPSARSEDFPFLADFRRSTIDEILCQAERDLSLRIGRMESWGLPGRAVRYVAARTE